MTEQVTNSEKKEIMKTLTREEINRIKETRKLEMTEPGTWTYKIAVQCDILRRKKAQWLHEISKCLLTVKSIKNMVSRLEDQLASGKITEELKPGIIMNADELAHFIENQNWTASFAIKDIPMYLANLRNDCVGHKDVAKREIMSVEEFEKFAEEVIRRAETLGFKVIDEA